MEVIINALVCGDTIGYRINNPDGTTTEKRYIYVCAINDPYGPMTKLIPPPDFPRLKSGELMSFTCKMRNYFFNGKGGVSFKIVTAIPIPEPEGYINRFSPEKPF